MRSTAIDGGEGVLAKTYVAEAHVLSDESTSLITSYLAGLTRDSNPEPSVAEALEHVAWELEGESNRRHPFLSVLLRTQGRRIECFKDALLCLNAQTDQDFELIVLVHDADDEHTAEVMRVVEQQPQEFSTRITVVPVAGGYRGTPLNHGLDRATGRFVSIYDDDDLLFADWVEGFHAAAIAAPARVLRAVASVQRLAPRQWPNGDSGFATSSWPAAEYSTEFDMIEHLRVNQTPFMSFAFPAFLFHRLGFRFDETLVVCEDWDMVMRAATLCGVHNVHLLTSIYRRWETGSSSYIDNSLEKWIRSESRVIQKLDSEPLMLPPGSATRIVELLEDQRRYRLIAASRGWRLAQPILRLAGLFGLVEARVSSVRRRLGVARRRLNSRRRRP